MVKEIHMEETLNSEARTRVAESYSMFVMRKKKQFVLGEVFSD